MIEDRPTFAVAKRSLDKRRQQVRVGMRPNGRRRLQSLAHGFGKLLHLLSHPGLARLLSRRCFHLLFKERLTAVFLRQAITKV